MFSRKKQANRQQPDQQAVAARIAGKIIHRQRKLAQQIGRWAGRYSRQQQAIAFAVFCLSFGLYCLYILYKAIF